MIALWLALAAPLLAVERAAPVPPALIQVRPVRLIVQPAPGAERRDRYLGTEGLAAIKAAVEAAGGRAKQLTSDGPSSIFESHVYLEAAPEAAVPLRDALEAAGLRVTPLASALRAIEDAPAVPAATDEELQAAAKRLYDNQGTALDHARDLGGVLRAVETADLTNMSHETRRETAAAIYSGLVGVGNAFNAIRGDQRQAAKQRFLDAHPSRDYDHVALNRFATSELEAPELKAEVQPIRALIVRAVLALERLGGGAANDFVLQLLPHAEYAAMEKLASDPRLRERYEAHWLWEIAASLYETLDGIRAGGGRDDGWHGSQRSGGYTNVEGHRTSMSLYRWERWRPNPAEMKHEILTLLGLDLPGLMLDKAIAGMLVNEQALVPAIDAVNKERFLAKELANNERFLRQAIQQAADAGKPLDEATIESYRQSFREQAESKYGEYDQISGQSVIDGLINHLGWLNPYYPPQMPGFDQPLYIERVLGIFTDAHARATEPGLISQLMDSAVTFLTTLSKMPLLDEKPALRAKAADLWAVIKRKRDALKIPLRINLDGVIDARPQIRGGEPLKFTQGETQQWAVWSVAESPDGKYVARAAADRTVLVWEKATGKLVKKITFEDARQYYGDSANSNAVGFTADGKLLLAAVFDQDLGEGRKSFHNKIRTYDLFVAKDVLGPADAVAEAVVPDVYVLNRVESGPNGPYFVSREDRRNPKNGYYEGADVKFYGPDGASLATFEQGLLQDLRDGLLLTSAPHLFKPALRVFDVRDPAAPKEVTPAWLADWAREWSRANPADQWGHSRPIDARLLHSQGRALVALQNEGTLELRDLETGALLRSVDLPSKWRADQYVPDPSGRYLAAVVRAPGNFQGATPERLMIWDLTTGEILLERETREVARVFFSRFGRTLIAAGKNGVEAFPVPARP